MSLDTAFALIGFAFVMSISPGPANFLLLASGANFGFRRSLPLVFGISLGFLAMAFAVGEVHHRQALFEMRAQARMKKGPGGENFDRRSLR